MQTIVPKIIHQIWIGPKPAPTEWMQTWKTKNPDYHYICWDETRLLQLDTLTCKEPLKNMKEINGQADIYRWEILYTFGGYFFDADSLCMNSLLDDFANIGAFSCYENEVVRPDLVATGAMGFPPKHPLVKAILTLIKSPEYQDKITKLMAWKSVGPGILTEALKQWPQYAITILPSYLFYPKHHTGGIFKGHNKVYGYQFWCTSHQLYDASQEEMEENNQELAELMAVPTEWVSIIIPCHNTKLEYITECLHSIQWQVGNFGMELIWINDGSLSEHSAQQIHALKQFEKATRYCRVIYLDNVIQQGCRNSLRRAVEHCTCEFIFKMDADDVMVTNRIQLQLEFMKAHPTLALSGGQIQTTDEKSYATNHPVRISQQEFETTDWCMNHPTFCFRKEALLKVDNYPLQEWPLQHPVENMMDDFEVVLRIFQKHEYVMNMDQVLVYYRIHSEQMTQKYSQLEIQEYRRHILQKYSPNKPNKLNHFVMI